jgi:hypothetical protein
VPGAGRSHVASRRKRASARIVQLGAGLGFEIETFSAGDQDSAVAEQGSRVKKAGRRHVAGHSECARRLRQSYPVVTGYTQQKKWKN